MLTHQDFIIRIATGAALGALIGLERDLHGRPVGLRTHLIVAMTAAMFMVISAHFVFFQGYGREAGVDVEVDASRIAASVVSGIGFLAGGAILRTGLSIQGMTTAAGLWLVTAIGLGAGAGMFVESGFVTLLGLVALTLLRRFEDKDDSTVRRKMTLTLVHDSDLLARIMKSIEEAGGRVRDLDYEKNLSEKRMSVTCEMQIPVDMELSVITRVIESFDGVLGLRISSMK
jgi:putative Mg2+ transporter-C (MgtC) family protein